MERSQAPTQVANFLSATAKFVDAPEAAMLYCRKAFECMIHTAYFDKNDKWPPTDKDGRYIAVSSVIKEIGSNLSRQTKEAIWSINAQIRPSMHWSVETALESGPETRHVESVINQINVIYIDLFGLKLSLEGSASEISTIENTIRVTVNLELDNSGIEIDSTPEEFELEEGELESVLIAASAAKELGFDFNPWDTVRLGNAYVLKGQYKLAEEHYEQAIRDLSKSEEKEDRKATACAQKGLGNVSFIQGRYADAEKLYTKSLQVSGEIAYLEGMARGLGSLALVASERGDNLESKRLYEEAIVIFEEDGNEDGLGTSLLNLSGTLWELGEEETSQVMLERALGIKRMIGDEHGVAIALSSIGGREHLANNLDKAEELHKESLAINRKIGDKRGECFSINHLGDVAAEKGDLKEAKELYQMSLEIAKDINLPSHAAHTKWDLGFIKMKEENWAEARRLLEESMAEYEDLGVFNMHGRIFSRLGNVALGEGDIELSEDLHRQAVGVYISQGIPISGWYAENGYVDPDADWEFPPN